MQLPGQWAEGAWVGAPHEAGLGPGTFTRQGGTSERSPKRMRSHTVNHEHRGNTLITERLNVSHPNKVCLLTVALQSLSVLSLIQDRNGHNPSCQPERPQKPSHLCGVAPFRKDCPLCCYPYLVKVLATTMQHSGPPCHTGRTGAEKEEAASVLRVRLSPSPCPVTPSMPVTRPLLVCASKQWQFSEEGDWEGETTSAGVSSSCAPCAPRVPSAFSTYLWHHLWLSHRGISYITFLNPRHKFTKLIFTFGISPPFVRT